MRDPLNKALVGLPGSGNELQTPALVMDLDLFEANIRRMADHCQKSGLGLRPHAKTHKCLEIARRQVAAGAVGICCAKLGEAEVMGRGGIESILLTSPVVTSEGIRRLLALNRVVPELMVVADNELNIEALGAAAISGGKPLAVLLDLDPGLHRTGIAPGDKAIELARQIDAHDCLVFMGLQNYAGHLMHIEQYDERREKSYAVMDQLADMRDRLTGEGIQCRMLTGGGTGTYDIDAEKAVLTELQGGSYIFMDREYNEVAGAFPFQTSLFVQMTVISNNTPKLATTDAGFKSFSTDADVPLLVEGAPEGAVYFYFGDEQGGILMSSENDELPLGSSLRAITPHCDPTINLYDHLHIIKDDMLVDIWTIDTRGHSA
jgi:D-serine deaminase-like pyridoxal phosphate-dependent protein